MYVWSYFDGNGCTCRCWLSFVFVFQGHVEGKPPARPDLAPFLRAWTGRWDILRSEFTATIHLLSSSGIGVIVRHGCQMSDYVKKKNLIFIQHTREKASFMHIKCIRLLHKKKTDREVNTFIPKSNDIWLMSALMSTRTLLVSFNQYCTLDKDLVSVHFLWNLQYFI